jgi:hypothetical protein
MFRVHVMRMYEPEQELSVRVLIVETSHAQPVYERCGTWSQCEIWIAELSGWFISKDELIKVRKRVEQKRMATIKQIRTSFHKMESIGFCRVDN